MNLPTIAPKYLASINFQSLSKNSQNWYKATLNKLVKLAPKDSDEVDIRVHWYKKLNNMKVSNAAKNSYLAVLKIVYRWAENEGQIDRSPVDRMKKFVSFPDKQEAYTQEEVEKIWESAETRNEKIYANTFRALFYTGCRPQELIDLLWNDVDLNKGLISIRSAKRREKGAISRKCNIINEVEQCITRAESYHEYNRRADFNVFRAPRGGKIDMGTLRSTIKLLCQKCVVPYKQLRNTRSGLGTAMIKKGYSLYDIQHTLGHKKISTTEGYLRESLEDKASRFKGL